MSNKRSFTKKLLMVFVFGMMSIGCLNAQVDTNLNGTWVGDAIYVFNNGNFELKRMDNSPFFKGTYITNNGVIIQKITHVHGGYFGEFFESKWYTTNEFQSALGTSEDILEWIYRYSISDNKLTLIKGEGEIVETIFGPQAPLGTTVSIYHKL